MNRSIDLEHFTLGPVETNCYLVADRWLVDPGGWDENLANVLNRTAPEAILLTHAHYDHIGGIDSVRTAVGDVPVFCHEKDQQMLTDPEGNMSTWTGNPVSYEATDCVTNLSNHFGDSVPEVLELPGHTPGSVGFYWSEASFLLSGDSLFLQSIGRTDLPGGDQQQLLRSIRQRIFSLPDETTVYPGHGPQTTVGQEKRSNPFLR